MSTDLLPGSAESHSSNTIIEHDIDAEVTCTQCGTTDPWGSSSWCPQCGYYPALGDHAGAVRHDSQSEDEETSIEFPVWAAILGLGVLAVLIMSLVVRFTVSFESGARTTWSLSQLGIGVFTLFAAQVSAGFMASFKSAEFSPMDIIMKPIDVWKAIGNKLPNGAWILYLGAWSASAIFGAVAIIGSIPYSSVFDDWGVKKRAEVNLVQEIVSEARKNGGSDEEDLEGAINDFVGEAEGATEEEAIVEELPREDADCVLVGYTKLNGKIDRLLLGTIYKTKLKYVGTIYFSALPEKDQRSLSERMLHYRRRSPVVKDKLPEESIFLKPVLMCRVSYTKQSATGKLESIEFEEMMADVN